MNSQLDDKALRTLHGRLIPFLNELATKVILEMDDFVSSQKDVYDPTALNVIARMEIFKEMHRDLNKKIPWAANRLLSDRMLEKKDE